MRTVGWHPLHAIDGFLAATAHERVHTFATRNHRAFSKLGIPVQNPFHNT
ncbi:MAG: hypothetical protein KIT83_12145 [Bryobacterales bacterium]|nr:hypothetical protein [Bryobacterales bacterium]